MEKRKTFHGRQVGKKRLLPIVFPLFLFLLIPLNGYGDDTPMPEVVQQNSTRITGVVKDAYGEPVIGANVKVVGTTQGTITDFEGKFSINVSGASAKIKISFIGYKDKEVTAKKGVSLNIVLEEDAQTLGEVQVVAYGVQKKVSITGAISSMKGDDLLKTPAGSLSNVLSGQITGISSVQYSGEPGADAADIYVRGVATWNNAKPLIQVDGVERDFSQIDPNEIESVTVLKDASATAVFGVRGANGVILITTKRGAEGKAKVSFSTSAGVNVRTKDLEFANSYQYASYYNMMKVNDGGVATFSDEQLETFRNHSNPLMYPDINWIDYCMNKAAFQSQHNVNISGGTSNMKYFVSAGKNREYAEYTSSCLITKDYRFRKGRMLVRAKIPTAMGAWPAIWTTGGSTDSWCWEWPLGGEIDLLEYYLVNGKPSVHANVCWGSDTRWNGKWQSYNRPVAEFIAKDKDWGKKYHIWRMDWCLDEDENTLRLYLDDELMNEIKDLKATTGNGSGGLDDWWRGSYRNPYLDEGNNAGKENDEGFGQCIWLNLALGSNGGEPDLSKFPLEYHVDYVRVYQFE